MKPYRPPKVEREPEWAHTNEAVPTALRVLMHAMYAHRLPWWRRLRRSMTPNLPPR